MMKTLSDYMRMAYRMEIVEDKEERSQILVLKLKSVFLKTLRTLNI